MLLSLTEVSFIFWTSYVLWRALFIFSCLVSVLSVFFQTIFWFLALVLMLLEGLTELRSRDLFVLFSIKEDSNWLTNCSFVLVWIIDLFLKLWSITNLHIMAFVELRLDQTFHIMMLGCLLHQTAVPPLAVIIALSSFVKILVLQINASCTVFLRFLCKIDFSFGCKSLPCDLSY